MEKTPKGPSFTVKTDAFEGPLDLLLHLIQKRKLHISDVSLAQITDDYLSYIEELPEFPTREAADFILVASTLVLIKSRALLPALELTEEEESDIEHLELRLRLLERFRALSRHIEKRYGSSAAMWYREPARDREPIFSPTEEITKRRMREAIGSVIANLPRLEAIPQVIVRRVVSLEDTITDLAERIQGALAMRFREFADGRGAKDKTDIIVSFLAMLELVKRGIIRVKQDKHFEDIEIETEESGVPRYL